MSAGVSGCPPALRFPSGTPRTSEAQLLGAIPSPIYWWGSAAPEEQDLELNSWPGITLLPTDLCISYKGETSTVFLVRAQYVVGAQ